MSGIKFTKLMAVLIGLLLVCLFLSSCYTEKKATQQATKAVSIYPEKIIPIFRNLFPCLVIKSDTTIVNSDTTFFINCPDTATGYFTVHDTITKRIQLPGKTMRVPVTLPLKTITVVKEIEDLSRVTEMSLQKDAAIKERDFYKSKSDKRGTMIKWLIFFLAGLSVPYIIKITKSAKKFIP